MQEPRIVLVLGAGASQPYGLLLGEALKCRVAIRTREMYDLKRNSAYDPDELKKFEHAVWRNKLKTMDEFLEDHPRFLDIGARLVADVIASYETDKGLFEGLPDWYTALFNELRLQEKGPDLSRLAVVTFNYDRSLEHFIADSIKHNCPESKQLSARDMWNKVKIVHAHGSLGEYPAVGYGQVLDNEGFELAAKGLIMLTDKRDQSASFKEAQQLVGQADKIVFIGFGYHKRTLDSLFPNESFKGKEIYGTCYGMLQDGRSDVMSYFQGDMQLAGDTLNAKSFMEALSKDQADRPLFSGLDDMRKAKCGGRVDATNL
jgi:hypothetical protein